MVKREIPFVVGVLSDLAGDRDKDKPLPKVQERKFVQVDPYNFDEVLRKISPRLQLSVKNTLQKDETNMTAVLNFESLSDFSPEKVAAKIPVLKALLEKRAQLSNLRSSLYGNDRLEQLLKEVLDATEADRQSPTTPPNKDDGGQH
jgi:type VI secretion system protein ImpB